MEQAKFIWQNGKVLPWFEAKVHCLSHALHYGSGVFESLRFYPQDKANNCAIFRLDEHLDRLFYSANALGMGIKYTKSQLRDNLKDLIIKNELSTGYIRILAHYGYGSLRVNPEGIPVDVVMAAFPLSDFLEKPEVKVKTCDYIRIHPKSTVADAKICGHYVNSIIGDLQLKGSDFHEILFLDTNGNLAEGAAQNLFFVKDKVLYTPSLGNILAGITRASVIDMARFLGYEVVEGVFSLEQLKSADEAFFTGTAVEITPITCIDEVIFTKSDVSNQIRNFYHQVVTGGEGDFSKWLDVVAVPELV